MTDMTLDRKLMDLCEARGWDQSEFARRLGAPKTTVSKWFAGKPPTLRYALRVAKLFGRPLDWLADDTIDDPPTGLSEIEQRILWLAEVVGYDDAAKRLADAKEQREASNSGKIAGGRLAPDDGPSSRRASG